MKNLHVHTSSVSTTIDKNKIDEIKHDTKRYNKNQKKTNQIKHDVKSLTHWNIYAK